MNVLLDTHAFLWWATEDAALSSRARRVIEAPRNDVFLSAVSVWEIVVKSRLGRLRLELPVETMLSDQMARHGFQPLALQFQHVLALDALPPHHSDPADRLLVAQALVEGMTLISRDRWTKAYPVRATW